MHSRDMRYSIAVRDAITRWLESGYQDLVSIGLNNADCQTGSSYVVWLDTHEFLDHCTERRHPFQMKARFANACIVNKVVSLAQ